MHISEVRSERDSRSESASTILPRSSTPKRKWQPTGNLCPRSDPGTRWLAFLRNHPEALAAMDFFTVPTVTFGVVYWFFAISHVAGVFCTATSHGIRQPCGLFSGCGKRFHRAPPIRFKKQGIPTKPKSVFHRTRRAVWIGRSL